MTSVIIIGDILVCGFLVAVVTYLYATYGDDKVDEAAHLPLMEDDE